MTSAYTELYVAILFLLSSIFIFIAALGVKKLPDIFCRMHASTKATTIAKAFSFTAAALYFWDEVGIPFKALLVLVFLFITSPVAAHLIARAAYKKGSQLTKETWHDDYKKAAP